MSGTSFDRAADYYDRTRGLTPEGVARNTEILASELSGCGRVLEVGVGTGQVALPLHGAGIPMLGADISPAMIEVLLGKAGGRPPFPLILGDATVLPLIDGAVGAALFRWVLHLIPDWRIAVREAVRVCRRGGLILAHLGSYGGPRSEIQERFAELTGVSHEPLGLGWKRYDLLDEQMASLGAAPREIPSFTDRTVQSLDEFIRGIEDNIYSWTWRIPPADLAKAGSQVRRWAEERWGSLVEPTSEAHEVAWRAYDLP
jgi:SAM-dependent methyltransferase